MRDIDAYLKQLRARGYIVQMTRGGHWHIRWQGKLVASTGSTPSKLKRGLCNLRSDIKRFERGQG